MANDDGSFTDQSFDGCGMIQGMEPLQNPGTGSNGVVFKANHVLDADDDPMQPAGMPASLAFRIQPVSSLQGLFFVQMHKNIEVLESFDTFQEIQYSVPAG